MSVTSLELTNNVSNRKRSTTTLVLKLQSMIARAIEEDNFVLVVSLDLNSTFDVFNVLLLLKTLKLWSSLVT